MGARRKWSDLKNLEYVFTITFSGSVHVTGHVVVKKSDAKGRRFPQMAMNSLDQFVATLAAAIITTTPAHEGLIVHYVAANHFHSPA